MVEKRYPIMQYHSEYLVKALAQKERDQNKFKKKELARLTAEAGLDSVQSSANVAAALVMPSIADATSQV